MKLSSIFIGAVAASVVETSLDDLSEDAKESLEVANQCLQTAYALNQDDVHLAVDQTLEEIFVKATKDQPLKKQGSPTPEVKAAAERLKNDGNELLRNEKIAEAIEKYSQAIELDGGNQVFYCNRAAAYSKMNNHYAAIEDCKRAIDMNPNYSKAYGRMGLAYASLEKHKKALDCFEKALNLEPDNESYKTNLEMSKEKMSTAESAGSNSGGAGRTAFSEAFAAGMGAGPGGMDFSGLLNNPALMNMAMSVLSDPNMQNMMGQVVASGVSGGGGASSGVEGLLSAGQRLAEQMQQAHPDIVDQLRRHVQGDNQPQQQQPPTDRNNE